MDVPLGGAVVRMYCTGLGDCFLIGLRTADGGTGHILIDCGVLKGTPTAREKMTRIMTHIRDSVAPRGLDAVVVTHAHWDHLSGFWDAKADFDKIRIKEVWLPWTEDDTDPDAIRLTRERRLAIRAALSAAARLQGLVALAADGKQREDAEATVTNIQALLEFIAPTSIDDKGDDAALVKAVKERRERLGPTIGTGLAFGDLPAGPTTEDLLGFVRDRVPRPRYIKPSPDALNGTPFRGVRIYALGPPTDKKFLGKDNPSTVPGKSEVYAGPGAIPLNEDAALLAAADDRDPGIRAWGDRLLPFDRNAGIEKGEAADDPKYGEFFRHVYGFGPKDLAPDWRRIDTDWLEAASQLALYLDNHVNNTSLVLAFELGEGKDAPVLLFPGDAQVGNWLSWHELGEDGSLAKSLLQRTVLYKVGHHASHNATLKSHGLELMTDCDRLVAMIPVDEKQARKKKGWDMPYAKLLEDLVARTQGRVFRADSGIPLLEGDQPEGWTKEKWDRFVKDTKIVWDPEPLEGESVPRPFFIQYTIRPR